MVEKMNIGMGSKIKDFFSNAKAMLTLLLGIVIIAFSVGLALYLSLHSLPSVLITLAGTFIGTFTIAGAVQYFRTKPDGRWRNVEDELREKKEENTRLNRELVAEREQIRELKHTLTTFANVTKIQPAFKIVPAEIDFNITDFYGSDPINETAAKKHPLSGNYRKEQDFYRGVYKYSGKTYLMVDLAAIKLHETDDEIIIYGPFAYDNVSECNGEEWLLPGRREHVWLRGKTENDMKVDKITVTEICDRDGELKQAAMVKASVKNLKMIEQMKTFTDNIVKKMIELMLKPTGKQIKFMESIPEDGRKLERLGEFISDFNRRIETETASDVLE